LCEPELTETVSGVRFGSDVVNEPTPKLASGCMIAPWLSGEAGGFHRWL